VIRFLVVFVFLVLLILGVESHVYCALKTSFAAHTWVKVVYYVFQIGAYGSVFLSIIIRPKASNEGIRLPVVNLLRGAIVAFALPKVVASSLLLLEDLLRGIRYAWNKFNLDETGLLFYPQRTEGYVYMVTGAACLLFVLLLYGIVFGKYRYQVKEVEIKSANLPKAFDGYRIVQVSDVHSGTFDSISQVQKGIDLINTQNPDLVLFTGDLVNNLASEIEPFIPLFHSIQSRDGKFSILGNHDYGDYVQWRSATDKVNNLECLIQNHAKMGFQLMRNSAERINKKGEHINLLGVENWGKPPFQQLGDLERATQNIAAHEFTILMSHDPSHWDYQVKIHNKEINLTLSGHTHGMQLGIDWLGVKWSPVKYRYRKWAGLYTENNRHLYVNRGFGFLGWPGRLGIWPEITLITLKKR